MQLEEEKVEEEVITKEDYILPEKIVLKEDPLYVAPRKIIKEKEVTQEEHEAPVSLKVAEKKNPKRKWEREKKF